LSFDEQESPAEPPETEAPAVIQGHAPIWQRPRMWIVAGLVALAIVLGLLLIVRGRSGAGGLMPALGL
jgi:hypothetical protein